VEKRAFKRTVFHVRDEEAALDIVQDSMIKLAQHYGDKPPEELPMLFQRILSNSTLDWFRRQKTRNALFTNMATSSSATAKTMASTGWKVMPATLRRPCRAPKIQHSAQVLQSIEKEIQELPARQREAFLMRYWEKWMLQKPLPPWAAPKAASKPIVSAPSRP
jgi:RNA polymerase sigma-70 factor (ECF subfamily)